MFRQTILHSSLPLSRQAAGNTVRKSIPLRFTVQNTRFFSVSVTRSARKSSKASYLLLVFPATTFCLGCWQLQRREQKLEKIQELEAGLTKEPIPLPRNLTHNDLENLKYQRVFVDGYFEHDKEVILGPRSLNADRRVLNRGEAGFQVLTPFRCAEDGRKIIVNRGWVPLGKKDPRLRSAGQVCFELICEHNYMSLF
eukprot:Colp12_sorted_trinity150504_noHs@33635